MKSTLYAAMAFVLWPTVVFGQTAFTYQGRLEDESGPVNDAGLPITFRLFDVAEAGEPLGGVTTVAAVEDGLFTALIDFGAVPDAFIGEERWLELEIDGTPLEPRQLVTAAPFALFCDTAGGVPDGSIGGPQLADGSITDAKIAPGFFLPSCIPWCTSGNTIAPSDFLGTLNNLPLVLKTKNWRAMEYAFAENTGLQFRSINVLGGSSINSIGGGVVGATIAGGGRDWPSAVSAPNAITADFATIGGGLGNTASGAASVIAGGAGNTASGSDNSTVAGGYLNTASNIWAAVGGGVQNEASGAAAVVAGGYASTASGNSAAVGGGYLNMASAQKTTVAGGESNDATQDYASIGGGHQNLAGSFAATVAGGYINEAKHQYTAVGGGRENTVDDIFGTIGGGYQNSAGIGSSVTIGGGHQNSAAGFGTTVAGGNGNLAQGDYSTVAGGSGNVAATLYTTVGGGEFNQAVGDHATIGGGGSNDCPSLYGTIGGGYGNYAGGYAATIPGGDSNVALGAYSFAAGLQAQALHYGTFVWADSQGPPFASTDPNQFLIRAMGNVGINTNTPAYTLDVNGLVRGTGAFVVSDLRYKTHVETVPNALDSIMKLRGVTFDWKEREFPEMNFAGGRQIGFIAQEVEEVLPELVTTDKNGYKAVAYANAVPVLVEAIHEQQETISNQQKEITDLTARLERLEAIALNTASAAQPMHSAD